MKTRRIWIRGNNTDPGSSGFSIESATLVTNTYIPYVVETWDRVTELLNFNEYSIIHFDAHGTRPQNT